MNQVEMIDVADREVVDYGMATQMSMFDNNYAQMCTVTSNYVCQANVLIKSRQNLSINAAKIVRACIMQIRPDDMELRAFKIKINELADMLGISSSNLYRDIRDLCTEISSSKLEMKQGKSWAMYPWAAECRYDDETHYVTIQLNSKLKPFLLNLKDTYKSAKYMYDSLKLMRSPYSVRIYEMIIEEIKLKKLPLEGADAILYIEDIRNGCHLWIDDEKGEQKILYGKISHLKSRVIDQAVKEINESVAGYRVTYTDMKQGRSIIGFKFHLETPTDETTGIDTNKGKKYA